MPKEAYAAPCELPGPAIAAFRQVEVSPPSPTRLFAPERLGEVDRQRTIAISRLRDLELRYLELTRKQDELIRLIAEVSAEIAFNERVVETADSIVARG